MSTTIYYIYSIYVYISKYIYIYLSISIYIYGRRIHIKKKGPQPQAWLWIAACRAASTSFAPAGSSIPPSIYQWKRLWDTLPSFKVDEPLAFGMVLLEHKC
jgi:hypothetical protein